ncbi:MAG: tryptophan--tRNA ligase [Patescibacteria group bacterium]
MASKEPLIVSGIQPSGRLHIGNWAGGLRNWLALQETHPERCLFFIADYHAMTVEYDPKERQHQVIDLAASLLALGLDSKKSTLFVQSDVPEVAELAWIFNTVTPIAEMERMTQYKDKAAKHAKNINMGLLAYPVLQAADILIYGGDAVPVGQDQVQHVETTRVIARNFNKRFGPTFPEPKALLNDTPKIMSLTEPTKKMSKSGAEKSFIALDDEPETIMKKMKAVPTEPSGIVTDEALKTEAYAGVALLLDLIELCGGKDSRKAASAESPVKYGDLKKRAAEAVAARFAEFRAKKAGLLKNPDRIRMVLASGGAKARAHAKRTMETVLKVTGLR